MNYLTCSFALLLDFAISMIIALLGFFLRTTLNKTLPVRLCKLKGCSIISYVAVDNSEASLSSDVVVPAGLQKVFSSTFPHCDFYQHQMWKGKGHTRGDKYVSARLMRYLELMGLEKNQISHMG